MGPRRRRGRAGRRRRHRSWRSRPGAGRPGQAKQPRAGRHQTGGGRHRAYGASDGRPRGRPGSSGTDHVSTSPAGPSPVSWRRASCWAAHSRAPARFLGDADGKDDVVDVRVDSGEDQTLKLGGIECFDLPLHGSAATAAGAADGREGCRRILGAVIWRRAGRRGAVVGRGREGWWCRTRVGEPRRGRLVRGRPVQWRRGSTRARAGTRARAIGDQDRRWQADVRRAASSSAFPGVSGTSARQGTVGDRPIGRRRADRGRRAELARAGRRGPAEDKLNRVDGTAAPWTTGTGARNGPAASFSLTRPCRRTRRRRGAGEHDGVDRHRLLPTHLDPGADRSARQTRLTATWFSLMVLHPNDRRALFRGCSP